MPACLFENNGEKLVWAAGLPAGRGHAFAMLISQQPYVRLTNGFLSRLATFFLPHVEPIPNDMGVECSAWHVKGEDISWKITVL